MSNDLVRTLALADALRRVAPEHVGLADSLSFCGTFIDADLTSPIFDAHVAAEVRCVTGPTPAERRAERDAEGVKRRATGQWTAEDVIQATPAEREAARNRGQMTALGIGPDKLPPKPMADVVKPTAAQVRQWNQMLPWQAQQARAKWAREVRERQGWTTAEPAPPVTRVPEVQARTRPTTEQLLAADRRRTELTADYSGAITREDCAAANPQVVGEWMKRGKLAHLGYAAPRQRGAR